MRKHALFVVSSTAQVEMMALIGRALCRQHGYSTVFVNGHRWQYRKSMEQTLQDKVGAYVTIPFPTRRSIEALLAKERPSIVVVGHDWNIVDDLFIVTASQRDIPTLLVQDGVLVSSREEESIREAKKHQTGSSYWANLPNRVFKHLARKDLTLRSKIELILFEALYKASFRRGIYGHGACSKMAVFGPAVRDMLVREGVDPARIVVTGNPKFDLVYHGKSLGCKQKVYNQWGIPIGDKLVILFTQYFVEEGKWTKEERADFVASVAKAVAAVPSTRLIIKLHPPYEKEIEYREIINGLNMEPQPIVCTYVPVYELANACDAAITVSSTAALETMAARKPVIIVDRDASCAFFSSSGAVYVRRDQDIAAIIETLLYDSNARNKVLASQDDFVFRQAYLQDGHATDRIVRLIAEMASQCRL